MKLSPKRFLSLALAGTLFLLLLVGGLNWAVDPLLHFHGPYFGLEPVLTNARYQNAGCLRHLDYDNLILGNSMCENFQASWFDSFFGGHTLKFPMSGSIAMHWEQELTLVQPRHPKNILMNMDYHLLSLTPDRANYTLPEFLYDDTPVNDLSALLNLDILMDYTLPTLRANAAGETSDLDTLYEWADSMPLGREYAMASYNSIDRSKEITYTPQSVLLQVHSNLARLERFFDAMPDTRFHFFISPWSMLYWHMKNQCGELDAIRAAYREGLSILTAHENVTVYLWNDDTLRALTADLDQYTDINHYSKDISQLLAQRICQGEGIVTADTCSEAVDTMFDYLAQFPYETLFE